MSYQSHRTDRDALIKWLSEPKFTHALTLNANRTELSPESLHRMFGTFCLDVDRLKAGRKRAERLPTWQRFEAIAFPEHIRTNIHLHVAANFSDCHWSRRPFGVMDEIRLEEFWDKITKGSGSIDIKPARDAGWARYITKESWRHDHEFWLAADFHNNDNVIDYALDQTLDYLANLN